MTRTGSALPNNSDNLTAGHDADNLRLVELWPDLFSELSSADIFNIENTFAIIWHEGWTPNRADVKELIERNYRQAIPTSPAALTA